PPRSSRFPGYLFWPPLLLAPRLPPPLCLLGRDAPLLLTFPLLARSGSPFRQSPSPPSSSPSLVTASFGTETPYPTPLPAARASTPLSGHAGLRRWPPPLTPGGSELSQGPGPPVAPQFRGFTPLACLPVPGPSGPAAQAPGEGPGDALAFLGEEWLLRGEERSRLEAERKRRSGGEGLRTLSHQTSHNDSE
ncbi:unnamed protein product, partial [Arctogadus glacialis]